MIRSLLAAVVLAPQGLPGENRSEYEVTYEQGTWTSTGSLPTYSGNYSGTGPYGGSANSGGADLEEGIIGVGPGTATCTGEIKGHVDLERGDAIRSSAGRAGQGRIHC